MQENVPKTSENYLGKSLGKSLLIGSLGATACAAAWIFYNRQKSSEVYALATVIKILKEFRKEFYPVYCHVSSEIGRMCQAFQAQGIPMSPEVRQEFTMIIYEKGNYFFFKKIAPFFKQEVSEIEASVYSKYHVSENNFQHCVRKVYHNDATVKALVKEMENLMQDALNGKRPNFQVEFPAEYTSKLCLDIISDAAKGFINYLVNTCLTIKEKGIFKTNLF